MFRQVLPVCRDSVEVIGRSFIRCFEKGIFDREKRGQIDLPVDSKAGGTGGRGGCKVFVYLLVLCNLL